MTPLARLTAPAAYGAFVLHPPVNVGLALAVQPLALAAELKLIAVLVAGVAGSFGLVALVSRAGPIARIIGPGPRGAREPPTSRPSERPASRPAPAPPRA